MLYVTLQHPMTDSSGATATIKVVWPEAGLQTEVTTLPWKEAAELKAKLDEVLLVATMFYDATGTANQLAMEKAADPLPGWYPL